MDYIEQIIDTSPWWHNPLWERDDRNLSAAAASGIHLRHLDDYMIKKPRVEIIRGPRQIGKTTEIKLIIKDLIKKRVDPRSIGYVICDIVSKPKELFEIVKSFSAHIALNKIPKGFLFLDEVTAVKEWQKALKTFIDMGLSKNIHIVLTGSPSIELKRGYERMPGRRSGGKDMLFLPVTLKKFCTAVDKNRTVPYEKLDIVVGSKKRFDTFKEAVYPASAFIKQCFANYLKIGGFPRALSDFVRLGRISDETILIYQSVLFSEFEKYRKSLVTLNHICEEVINNLATPLSYNSIMRNTGISSADTVKEYIEMLCRAFLGVELFCLNI